MFPSHYRHKISLAYYKPANSCAASRRTFTAPSLTETMTSPAGCRSWIDPTPVPLEQPCQHLNHTTHTHTCVREDTYQNIVNLSQSPDASAFSYSSLFSDSAMPLSSSLSVPFIAPRPLYCGGQNPVPRRVSNIRVLPREVSIGELRRGTEICIPSRILTAV